MKAKIILCIICVTFAISSAAGEHVGLPNYETADEEHNVIRFAKYMYSVMGDKKDAAALAKDFKEDYDALNTDGKLGIMLSALFEMRLEDILVSAKHVQKMRDVLTFLDSKDT